MACLGIFQLATTHYTKVKKETKEQKEIKKEVHFKYLKTNCDTFIWHIMCLTTVLQNSQKSQKIEKTSTETRTTSQRCPCLGILDEDNSHMYWHWLPKGLCVPDKQRYPTTQQAAVTIVQENNTVHMR